MPADTNQIVFPVSDYDLAATLTSGQAFRWQPHDSAWVGVIGRHWVKLVGQPTAGRARSPSAPSDVGNGSPSLPVINSQPTAGRAYWSSPAGPSAPLNLGIIAQTAEPVANWHWLTHYLQIETDLVPVLASFPDDAPMRSAVGACRGLRLLRQDPWECLASFILSSTKQIVQIRQIIGLLCERYGEPVAVPSNHPATHSFPTAARLASTTETELRACKMGFRAPYLLAVARAVDTGHLDLEELRQMPVADARAKLVALPGVGPKIADCVLLFAYGFQAAFPVDVWVMKALRQLYFPRRRPSPPRLRRFVETYFGTHAGYAQQYLFHYMRTRATSEPWPTT